MTVAHGTVANIISCIGFRRNHKSIGLSLPKVTHRQHRRSARTKSLIRKIDKLTSVENPLSLTKLLKKLKVDKKTVECNPQRFKDKSEEEAFAARPKSNP